MSLFIPFCAHAVVIQEAGDCTLLSNPLVLKDTYERTGHFLAETPVMLTEHISHMLTDLLPAEIQLITERTLQEVLLVNSSSPAFLSWKITFWVKVGRWRCCITISKD